MKEAALGMFQLTGRYRWPWVALCQGPRVSEEPGTRRTRACAALGLGIQLLNAQCTKRFKHWHSPVHYNSTYIYLAFPALPLPAMWPWHFNHSRPQSFQLRIVRPPISGSMWNPSQYSGQDNYHYYHSSQFNFIYAHHSALSLWSGFSEWKITSWWQ